METFVNRLLLMSSIVRDFRAFKEVPMSVMALSWRYRRERLSIPSKSATATCEQRSNDFRGLETAQAAKQYLFDLVVVYSQVLQGAREVCRNSGQVIVLEVQTF